MGDQRPIRAAARRTPQFDELEVKRLLASVSLLNPAGPIASITVADDGSFQVLRTDFPGGQVYPSSMSPGDAGLFLRHPDGTVVGFDAFGRAATHYRSNAGSTRSYSLHALSLGLSDDGDRVILLADNRGDGNALGQYFQLTQVTSYTSGDDFFRVDNTIINLGANTLTLDVFAAADLYLADHDQGVGYLDASTGAVGGADLSGTYNIFVQPNTAGGLAPSGFQGGHYQGIWRAIGEGRHLNNAVPLPAGPPPWTRDDLSYLDNGAALEWQGVTVAPGSTARISYFWSFGGSQSIAPDAPPELSPSAVQAVRDVSYTGVVATFTSSDALLQASDFLATVAWGDGTYVELAQVRPRQGASGFEVVGTHTYSQGGQTSATVSVVAPGGAAAVVHSPVTVSDDGSPPPGSSVQIAGNLAAESDRGVSNSDHITNENRPRFLGTATNATTWQLYAVSTGPTSNTIPLGVIAVGETGTWSLQVSEPIPDGVYTVVARLQGPVANLATFVLISAELPLVIDTIGPRVTALQVAPRNGQLQVQLTDENSGLDISSLGRLEAFRLTNRVQGRLKAVKLAISGVSATTNGTPATIVSLVTSNRRLPASRNYVFTMQPLARDLAGNTLAGQFVGRFPTGAPNGSASHFEVNIQTNNQKLLFIKAVKASMKKKG